MRLIAHRGCPLLHLENTIQSFLKALDLGYDMIEMDIQKTLDNQLIVFHDDTLERLSLRKEKQAVHEFTYAQLQNIPLVGNQRIPLLEDVLNLLDDKIQLNLELKSVGTCKLLNDILLSRKPISPYLISSFLKDELSCFTNDMKYESALLVEQIDDDALEFLSNNPTHYLHCSAEDFSLERLGALKEMNVKCQVYTINNVKEFERFSQYPIHGIFTDNHQLLSLYTSNKIR